MCTGVKVTNYGFTLSIHSNRIAECILLCCIQYSKQDRAFMDWNELADVYNTRIHSAILFQCVEILKP